MVKLVSDQAIAYRLPQDRTGVTQRNNINPGLSQAAGVLEGLADRQITFQENEARAKFVQEKARLDREFKEEPGDFTDMPERYNQRLSEILNETAGGIGSGMARQEFINAGMGNVEQATNGIRDFAFGLEREDGRARIMQNAEGLREVFLNGDDEAVAEALDSYDGLVESGVDAGYYGADEAEALRQKWRQDAAVGKLKMMDPRDALTALDSPWSENIPSDTRAGLERDLRAKQREAVAMEAVDGYMAGDMSQSDARARAREQYGDDPETRKEVERRIDYAYSARLQAERLDREQAAEEADQFIQGGGTVAELDQDIKSKLDSKTLDALRAVEMKMVNRHPVVTDTNAYYELVNLAGSDQSAFADVNLLQYRDRLSQGDFQQLAAAQKTARGGKDTGEYGSLKGLRNMNQTVDDVARSVGLTQKDNPEEMAQFRDRMTQMLVEYQQNNGGKKPTPTEWQQMVKQEAVQVTLPTPWYQFDKERRGFQVAPGTEVEIDIDSVPEQDKLLIIDALERRNIPVTDEAIVNTYMKGSNLKVR